MEKEGGYRYAKIVPIPELRNTNEISERCRQSAETDIHYKKRLWRHGHHEHGEPTSERWPWRVYRKLMQAEAELDAGKAVGGEAAFAALKARYK